MDAPPRLTRIAPIIPVFDLPGAVAFFQGVLGFSAVVVQERHAILERDAARFTLIPAAPDATPGDPARECSAYIWVEELDRLWSELEEGLRALPASHVRAPFVQEYGMREFHVIHGPLLIFFGEAV
ncbi:MAG: VOC family protein [Pseudomonadota bacterium]